MIESQAGEPREAPNHPLAIRMGVIAALSQNMIIGTIFGSFGVLVASVQARLHATPEMSSAGSSLVIVGSAIFASAAGVLAARFSLRLLMAVSAVLATCAWLILAFTSNYILYLAAYGLFLGPAMALGGSVLPPTLVTRWFSRNRGLALGIVHLPIIVALLPVVCNWVLQNYGASATYLMLAALCGLILLPVTFFVIEQPPAQIADTDTAAQAALPVAGTLGVLQLLATPRFWAFAFAVGVINTGSVIMSTHLVPMAMAWHFDAAKAALLASIMAFSGMAGSILFGWVTDRLGGGRTLALIAVDAGLLWLLLLLELPYPALALVIGLLGLHGSGSIPALSRGIAEGLGAVNFSRAFGLTSTVTLPVTVIGIMGTARVYQMEGNYIIAIVAMVLCYAVAAPLGLYAARRKASLAPASAA